MKWKAQQSQVLYQKNAQRVGRGLHQMPQASRRSRDFFCRRFNSFFLFCYNTNIYKMWKPRKKIQRNYHPGHTPKLLLLDFCFICGTALVQNRYHLNEPCFFLFIYLVKSRVLFFTPENYFCDDWSKRENVHSVTIFVL